MKTSSRRRTVPMAKSFIGGCAGPALSDDEKAFFRTERPWGLILFARNCLEPSQVGDLVAEFRSAVGRDDAPVLIDQEGGRVQRLGAPHWRSYPSGARIARACEIDRRAGLELARNVVRLIADDLSKLGVNVNCLPVLDVPQPGTHEIIGDRAYGTVPQVIAEIGRAMSEGLMEQGVLPVMKHIPGHGRAAVDSHLELPRVEASREELRRIDFAPFAELAHLPLAMTAHVVYAAFDGERPATHSARIVDRVIREEIGFDGLLMTDDLSMEALDGDHGERARRAIAAGCDVVLHCNGRFEEMRAVASAVPELSGKAADRARRAMDLFGPPTPYDRRTALNGLRELMTRADAGFRGQPGDDAAAPA